MTEMRKTCPARSTEHRPGGGWRPNLVLVLLGGVMCLLGLMSACGAPVSLAAGCSPATESSPGYRNYLPACRAYELVSPGYAEGYPRGDDATPLPVSSDGQRVLGRYLGTFAGQEGLFGSNPLGGAYLLSRGSGGWRPEALSPPVGAVPYSELLDASSSLQQSLWAFGDTVTFGNSVGRFYLRSPDDGFNQLGPISPGPVGPTGYNYLGSSDDFDRVVFNLQTTEEELWPGDSTFSGVNTASLYEYRGSGASEPTLVGVRNEGVLSGSASVNEGAEMITDCGTKLGSGSDTYGAVSANGFAVFFTAAAKGCTRVNENGEVEEGSGPPVEEVYARINGQRTLDISEPPLSVPGRVCTGICRESEEEVGGHVRSPGIFAGAGVDGDRVYFMTAQALVDADRDEAPDLYMEELSGSDITKLVMVSEGEVGEPTPGSGAEVQGMSQVTPDGGRAFFVARGQLTGAPNANGETAQLGEANLYSYDAQAESLSFVTTFAAADAQNWAAFNYRPVQSSPNGHFLVFLSRRHIAGTGDESGNGTEVPQLFRYDADSGSIVRVSIGQSGLYLCLESGQVESGYNCDGNVQSAENAPAFVPRQFFGKDPASSASSGFVVDDAGNVVFESRAALTPQAANGVPNNVPGMFNVYEYRGGNVFLISDGVEGPLGTQPWGAVEVVNPRPAYVADGAGILFSTQDALVPQDRDSQVSLYMAQADGGFPAAPVAVGCTADGCQGQSPQAEQPGTVGSTTVQGVGNFPKAHKKHKKPHKKHKRQRHRKHRPRHHQRKSGRKHRNAERGATSQATQGVQRIDGALGVGR